MAVIRNPKTGQESNLIGLSPTDRNKFLGVTPSAGETALLSKAKQRLQAGSGLKKKAGGMVTGGGASVTGQPAGRAAPAAPSLGSVAGQAAGRAAPAGRAAGTPGQRLKEVAGKVHSAAVAAGRGGPVGRGTAPRLFTDAQRAAGKAALPKIKAVAGKIHSEAVKAGRGGPVGRGEVPLKKRTPNSPADILGRGYNLH